MVTRTFTLPTDKSLPRGLWFHLNYDASGRMVGVEEHDGYQGGPISMSEDSWEQTFISAMERRAPAYIESAKAFLHGTVSYFVKGDHTLGYVNDRQPELFNILSGNPTKGGHDWKDGYVHLSPLDVLVPATHGDFDSYRVSPKGHL